MSFVVLVIATVIGTFLGGMLLAIAGLLFVSTAKYYAAMGEPELERRFPQPSGKTTIATFMLVASLWIPALTLMVAPLPLAAAGWSLLLSWFGILAWFLVAHRGTIYRVFVEMSSIRDSLWAVSTDDDEKDQ